jgi:hypothetical protein
MYVYWHNFGIKLAHENEEEHRALALLLGNLKLRPPPLDLSGSESLNDSGLAGEESVPCSPAR